MNMTRKTLTDGEFALSIIFGCLAFLSLYIASQAYTSAYAFHAALFCVGSATGVFLILRRYESRNAKPVAAIVDGKPNYNLGPVKFASLAAVFWGISASLGRAAFTGRLLPETSGIDRVGPVVLSQARTSFSFIAVFIALIIRHGWRKLCSG